jgi:hypothetical protein
MIPEIILSNLTTINVVFVDFDGNTQNGEIVCNVKVSSDLELIFNEIYDLRFPIYQIKPIEAFDNDDMKSVVNNNTSCFNFRMVIGSNKLSDHSTGNAIDINPMQNPWIHPSAHKIPGREYNTESKGTINSGVVEIFKKYGWNWGGDWKNPDYQHFFKPDNDLKNKVLQIKESKYIANYIQYKKRVNS